MRGSALVGLALVLVGLVLLFLLRDLLLSLIVIAIGILGIVIGFALVVIGLGVLFGGWWVGRVPYGPDKGQFERREKHGRWEGPHAMALGTLSQSLSLS